MKILYFSFFGIMLLIYAHYPELRHYYRMSKLRPPGSPLYAEIARRGTEMSIRYSSTKYCVICRHLFLKKSVLIAAAYSIMLLSLVYIIVSCPVEMPILLTVILGSFLWVSCSCNLLLWFIRRTRLSLILSVALAVLTPPFIYFIFYNIFILTNLRYVF